MGVKKHKHSDTRKTVNTQLNSKLFSLLKTYKPALFLIFVLALGLSARLYSANMPAAEERATSIVEAQYKLQGKTIIDNPEAQKKIIELSRQYKDSFTDPEGNLYLIGSDSYLFLKQAKSALEGEKSSSFFVLSEVYIYKTAHFFNKSFTLPQAAYWLPVIFALLSITLIFFIARIMTNETGGLIAGTVLALHPQFFTATQPGFADTNGMNIFFSILAAFLVLLILRRRSLREKILYAVLTTLIFAIWSTAWNGYYFMLAIIFLFAFCSAAYWTWINRDKFSRIHTAIITITLIALIIAAFFIAKHPSAQSRITHIKERIGYEATSPFPSTASTTSELLSAPKAIALAGNKSNPHLYLLNGWFLAILTLAGLVISAMLLFRNNPSWKYALFTIIWFISLYIAGYNSVRFISYIAPPAALLISLSAVKILILAKRFSEQKKLSERFPDIVIGIIVIMMIISTTTSALGLDPSTTLGRRSLKTPAMNDIIFETGNKIKTASTADAIINSWWDKGYAYEYAADREVMMDNGIGGSADPRIYWTALALMTTNYTEMLKIFEKIDCGNITTGSSLLNYTTPYCTPPEAFILVDNDLISRMDQLRYYAETDLKTTEHPPFIPPKASSISEPTTCFPNNEQTMLRCGDRFIVDLNDKRVSFAGKAFPGVLVSQKYFVRTPERGDYSLMVYPEIVQGGNVYKAVLLKSDLIDTTIVRMYFMKGYGIERIEHFDEISDPLLGRIVTYRVNWR
ncbi:MAG TPA: STT3 domain-containing protein [Candidatus Nanoarchaeia archaeon]|nr:STT3 domain-containing protein [Candidatus Nanoarchaeia archaeon]